MCCSKREILHHFEWNKSGAQCAYFHVVITTLCQLAHNALIGIQFTINK